MDKTTLLITACMFSYTGLLVAFSRAPLTLNSHLVGIIINAFGVIAPLTLLLLSGDKSNLSITAHSGGFMWALFGGLCLAVFTFTLTAVFAQGENVSFVTPLVYGFAIVGSSIIAALFFSEKISRLNILGFCLVVAGIAVIVLAQKSSGEQQDSINTKNTQPTTAQHQSNKA